MGTRVPVHHYGVGQPANSYVVEGSLHDLNTVDGPSLEIQGISEVGCDGVTGDGSLDNGDGSVSVECLQESFSDSLPLHNAGVHEEHSGVGICSDISSSHYNVLTMDDVAPIETARARFLEIIVNSFIGKNIVEKENSTAVEDSLGHEKTKRKQTEICYEGDPRVALPLMYIANLYETLVTEANTQLATLGGFHEKSIGVALEAAGGLYRRLVKLFPTKGPFMFGRRELATSLETRTKFPELVVHEAKRVRFVVINGLEIIEKPNNMTSVDAEWFKRLTGRCEVSVSTKDYKFYCPRHKYRRVSSSSISDIPGLPAYTSTDDSSAIAPATRFSSLNELQNSQHHCLSKHHIQPLPQQVESQPFIHNNDLPARQFQNTSHISQLHQCQYTSHTLHEVSDSNEPVSQQIACMDSVNDGHSGRHLHLLPTGPAKYCDQCGAPFLRVTSKFCFECGAKRLGT